MMHRNNFRANEALFYFYGVSKYYFGRLQLSEEGEP